MENQNLENENGKCFAAIPISEAFEKDADVFQCLNCETETEIARDEDLIKKYGGGQRPEDMQYGVFKDTVLHVNVTYSILEIERTQIDCISCKKCGTDLGFQLITVKARGDAAEVGKVKEKNVEDGHVKKRKVTEGTEEKGRVEKGPVINGKVKEGDVANGKAEEGNLKKEKAIEKRFILFINKLKLNRQGKSKEKRYDVNTGDI